MKKPVINLSNIELQPRPADFAAPTDSSHAYDASMGQVASRIGAKLLGYNVTSIPPGNRAFPRHNHHVNEEMFLILEGTGEIKIGDDAYAVGPQDVIACPPGGQETAHQLINTGTSDLKFLAVSTRLSPEYVEYPDSGKFGAYANRVDKDGKQSRFEYMGREGSGLDYWDGE